MVTEKLPEIIAYDATEGLYLPTVRSAGELAGCLVSPYDFEKYALGDLETERPVGVVAVLHRNSHEYKIFEGKHLLDKALSMRTPSCVIAEDNMKARLNLGSPNLFISKQSEEITETLAAWLIELLGRGN